jgi:hypothetical protein
MEKNTMRFLLVVLILLLSVAIVLPATSASSGEVSISVSKPTIFIGESLMINVSYQVSPDNGNLTNVSGVRVFITEMSSGAIVERIDGVMSAGGNFICSFTANESTDFGYYSAYVIVGNVSGMAEFQVSPSLLDNWMLGNQILELLKSINGMVSMVFTYFIPVAALIGCTVGAFAYVKSRLPESDWEDFKKWFFRGREWRIWKKFSPYTDARDTDRRRFMRTHFKTISSYEGKLDAVRYDRMRLQKIYDKKKGWMQKNLIRFVDGDNFLAEMKAEIDSLVDEEKKINDRINTEILKKKKDDLGKRRTVKRIVKKAAI